MKMRRLIIFILFMGATISGFAQNENKLSASTMMFLSEQRGEIVLPKADAKPQPGKRKIGARTTSTKDIQTELTRPIAEPEYVNGVKMISAFLCNNDCDFTAAEALGVIIECKFDSIAVALIPVDKIMDVAALSNVTNIEVAEMMTLYNDEQRTFTNTDDVLCNTNAAQALGITTPYTGKGVILGIIDQGIDFQHKAFKDKNGNTRIKQAYTNSSTFTTHSTESAINALTYDVTNDDHGTHVATTAGGSSVIISGNNVTVTDDHANATYGGMAPEADLAIAGLKSLTNTAIIKAIIAICNYADEQGKPCVVNLSLGSIDGPHDGTGVYADVLRTQMAKGNHIVVYAASNDGMRAKDYVKIGTSNGGGCYASGMSSKSIPMMVNVQHSYEDADGNVILDIPTINAYARTPNVAVALKLHVVDTNTGEVIYSSDEYTTTTLIDITGTTGLAHYFYSTSADVNKHGDKGKIYLQKLQNSSSSKHYWKVYAPKMTSRSYTTVNGIKKGNYAFCVSVYPTDNSNSTIIDMWEIVHHGCWFGNDLTLNSTYAAQYNLVTGSDDCSVSNEACYDNVITVGAYTSKNAITNYEGNTNEYFDNYPNIGDHCYFSSWQAEGSGPLGTPLPTISAPGAKIVAGVNHYHTASDNNSYFHNDRKKDLVVNGTSAYGVMQGTSMSAPCVSGIIALWLQACVEKGITATPDYIKEVMQNTWITDEWTNGTGNGAHGAKTFGTHGKIDALAGLRYILGITNPTPVITATTTELTFDTTTDTPETQTFEVTGVNLEGNIIATLNDENGVFSIDPSNITAEEAVDGKTVNVTFTPTEEGTYTATLTLTSDQAESVTVQLSATATKVVPEYFDVTISEVGLTTLYLDFPVAIPYETYRDLLGVYYIYELRGKELRSTRLRKDIPAYTGVIVQGNSGVYRFPKIEVATPLKYPTLLSGSTKKITVREALENAHSSGTVYTLGRGYDSYINFYKYSGSTLAANKAFFIYEGGNNAKFSLGFEEETTGINALDRIEEDGTWYTIQGVKLTGKPTQKGLYIHNGNTYINK